MYTAPPHRHLLCGVARISRNAPVLSPFFFRFLVFVEIRGYGAVPFQFSQFSSVQFSYAMKPGGPEWGKRRLWAAQGVLRAVQTGAKDLDLSAAP